MLVLLYSVYAGYWWDRFMTIIHCGTSEPFFQLNAVQRMITIAADVASGLAAFCRS